MPRTPSPRYPLILAALLSTPALAAAPQFTDWTFIDITTDVAAGSIGPVNVTLTGHNLTFATTDGSYTGFARPYFTPTLPASDYIEFVGSPDTFDYVISFDRPVHDVVLHLGSLASRITFPDGTNPTMLSGEFALSGNVIQGQQNDNPSGHDTNGTVLLPGPRSVVAFSAFYDVGSADGIALQIAATPPLPGDANLNGLIDPDDFLLTDRGRALALSGWSNGDFNVDSVVDDADLAILDASFSQQTTAPVTSPIPEPAAITVVLLIGAVALPVWRRRTSRTGFAPATAHPLTSPV